MIQSLAIISQAGGGVDAVAAGLERLTGEPLLGSEGEV